MNGVIGLISRKALRGNGFYSILGMTLLYNAVIIACVIVVHSFVFSQLLKILLVCCNIYQLYYLLLSITINYAVDDKFIYILGIRGIKKITIPISSVLGYSSSQENIEGVKISGYGSNTFAFGKTFLNKLGTTYMFVTSKKNILFLQTEDMNYGISPENAAEFIEILKKNQIKEEIIEKKSNLPINPGKDKKFLYPFITVSIIIVAMTLNPFIMYLKGSLPSLMPLNFNEMFEPLQWGSGKQFAFTQMVYGAMNMVVLFCMYYASYFYSRYDRKSSYKFIYIALLIALVFLIVQFRILILFS